MSDDAAQTSDDDARRPRRGCLAERRAALRSWLAPTRWITLHLAGADAHGLERRAHADPADGRAASGSSAASPTSPTTPGAGWASAGAASRRRRRRGGELPRHERGLRPVLRRRPRRSSTSPTRSAAERAAAPTCSCSTTSCTWCARAMNGPHVFLAFVQGAVGGGGLRLQEEPVPARRPGRRARPAVGGARPQARRRARSTASRCTSAASSRTSTSTARSRSGCSAPPRSASFRPAIRRGARRSELHRVAAGGEPHRARRPRRSATSSTASRARSACSRTASSIPACPTSSSWSGRSRRTIPTRGRATTSPFAAKADDDPTSPMRRWRLDDEKVVYPTYELITRHKEQLETPSGLLQHLHPQGLLALARRHAGDGQPDRHPEGLARLAALQLHHLPRAAGAAWCRSPGRDRCSTTSSPSATT